jgi:outer membrane immunogenic protein
LLALALALAAAPGARADGGLIGASGPITWSGLYIGAHLSRSWVDIDVSTVSPPQVNTAALLYNQAFSDDGFGGGAELGYNWQIGKIVLGVAADATYLGFDRTSLHDVVGLDEVYRSQIDWLVTLRGRVGVDLGRSLFYATAGAAFGNVNVGYQNFDATHTVIQNEAFQSEIRAGWVVGVGVEHAFTSRLTAKIEYLHADLGTTRVRDVYGPNGDFHADFAAEIDLLKLGLNYKF